MLTTALFSYYHFLGAKLLGTHCTSFILPKTFRVDKMKNIEILDEKAAKSHNSLDIGLYANQIFSMFGGEVENVTLSADNSLIGVFIDKFGKDISIIKNENTFDITVKAAVSTSFFGWLFQLSDKAKIIEPACVLEKYLEQIEKTKENYN